MAGITTYVANATLSAWLRNIAFTPPTTVYVALYTAAPGAGGGGTEVSGGAYARQSVAWNALASGSTANSAKLSFPIATANWGTVVALGIHDALTGGNLLFWCTQSSQIVNTGQTFAIAAGSLTNALS